MSEIHQPRILVIDDDSVIRRVVSKSLAEAGYTMQTASTGVEGIALARTWLPDLVLCDVMMPEMDGYQVCRQLRQDPHTLHVPIILLTALDETDSVVAGLQSGADDYVIKPFEIAELLARVKTHLRRAVRDINANPLTGLPGNPIIEQVINDRIKHHAPLAVLYIDLTNFKPYNDEYGWLKGDQIIKMLAEHIAGAVQVSGSHGDFIGHVGGDDFILVSVPDRAEAIAKDIIARFDAAIPQFYPTQALERGFVQAIDRQGNPFRASLVTVAIAIVTNKNRAFKHIGQISSSAAEVKKFVKSLPGSQYVFDRRLK